ncbi:MAG: hypothetical protein FWC91_14750 [Defluviitaleaceae bacterium]|nr:hypothetical protein [Defluviitaleaceae bacterium]
MKFFKKNVLLFLIIILLISCTRNKNIGEEQIHEEPILLEKRTIDSSVFEATLTEINRHILNTSAYLHRSFYNQEGGSIVETIALSLDNDRMPGTPGTLFRGAETTSGRWNDVSSLGMIIQAQGYYIQQGGRAVPWQPGRAPEILALSVENGTVYIREIDISNGEIITRSVISLEFNGITFAHNYTRLRSYNGNIRIMYRENAPEDFWQGRFNHYGAYTFAGYLLSPMPDNVLKLTSDYLRTFVGRYVFDSYKIIHSENISMDEVEMQNRVFYIGYSTELKSLTVSRYNPSIHYGVFVETTSDEPFAWTLGEGGLGFEEIIYYFYRGGIVVIYQRRSIFLSDPITREVERVERIKYVAFFRKDI